MQKRESPPSNSRFSVVNRVNEDESVNVDRARAREDRELLLTRRVRDSAMGYGSDGITVTVANLVTPVM